MVRKILNVRNPLLRKKSKPVRVVDKKITALIKDLKDTLEVQKDPEGVGLAAPQIGKNLRIFAMKPGEKTKIVINPKIISTSKPHSEPDVTKTRRQKTKIKTNKEKNIMEGCLSLPHYYGPIKKPSHIKISYLNEKGEKVEEKFKGFEAQIVQHEIDHLKGVLFIDRLLEQKKPLYQFKGEEWEEVELI